MSYPVKRKGITTYLSDIEDKKYNIPVAEDTLAELKKRKLTNFESMNSVIIRLLIDTGSSED